MKKLRILLLLSFLVIGFTVNAMGPFGGNNGKHNGHNKGNNGNQNGAVGAPLDGGLLTVLGVAGVAYFAARKKSKKLES